MALLSWVDPEIQTYAYGVDRGVYYSRFSEGIAWPGLISVTEDLDQELTSMYLDGIAFAHLANKALYSAEIECFSRPKLFEGAEGIKRPVPFLALTQQPRDVFGFSYRTYVGNGVAGALPTYKIHLMYNASISPNEKGYQTLGGEVEPTLLTLPITCIPIELPGGARTAHVEVPSTHPKIGELESMLYGTSTTSPVLPDLDDLYDMLGW